MPSKTPHLTKEEIERFRSRLEEMLYQLNDHVEELQEQAVDAVENLAFNKMSINDAENASAAYEQELSITLLESEEELRRLVEAALGRIEEGVYGICAITGKPILKERLEILPYTPYSLEGMKILENLPPDDEGEDAGVSAEEITKTETREK